MKRANDLLKPVKYCLTTLYVGIGLVLIRNIFRTIEFADGNNTQGYFLTREAFYYGLETLPIFLCCVRFHLPFTGIYTDVVNDSVYSWYLIPHVIYQSIDSKDVIPTLPSRIEIEIAGVRTKW